MKNYNLTDYTTFSSLHNDMCKELNVELADLSFSSTRLTDCEVLEIVKPTTFSNKPDFIIEISCKEGIKQYCLRQALFLELIKFDNEKTTLLNSYFEKLDLAHTTWKNNLEEEFKELARRAAIERQAREARKAELEAQKAKEEAEKKFQIRIAKATDKFKSDIKRKVDFNVDTIDWLKENVLSISATIPSHLEKAFTEVFGDQPHKTVDSRRKTSGGYSMKFAATFSLRIKNDTTTIPVELANKIKNNVLHDTSYIANLVRAYDFKFGKQA